MPRKKNPIEISNVIVHVLPVHDIAGEPLWVVTGEEDKYSLRLDDLDLPEYACEHHKEGDFWRVDDEHLDDALDSLVEILDDQNIEMEVCEKCTAWNDGGHDICGVWGRLMDDVVAAGFELREEEDVEFKEERDMPLQEWFKRVFLSDEAKIVGKALVSHNKKNIRDLLRARYGIELSDEFVDQIIEGLFGDGTGTPNTTGMSRTEACEVLGVSAEATREEILKAFREKAHEHHPDKGGDKDKFMRVMKAREVLVGK